MTHSNSAEERTGEEAELKPAMSESERRKDERKVQQFVLSEQQPEAQTRAHTHAHMRVLEWSGVAACVCVCVEGRETLRPLTRRLVHTCTLPFNLLH